MKKFTKTYSILTLVLLLFTTSCSDFLVVEPKSTWGIDTFYSNATEAEMALAGIYSVFASGGIYGSSNIAMNTGTDESYYNRRYSGGWTVSLYNYNASDKYIKGHWSALYKAINLANMFEEQLKSSEFTPEEYDRLLGESRFLRALAYFHLVNWYEDVPMPLTYSKELGANHLAATPMKEVYEQVVKDFTFASEHLLHANDAAYVPGRANKMAAHGLLARVYMKMAGYPLKDTEKYQKAKEECEIIFTDGWHGLTIAADGLGYREAFLKYIQNEYNMRESLFEISYGYLRQKGISVHGPHGNLNGLAFSYRASTTGMPSAYAMENISPVTKHIYAADDKRSEWNVQTFSYNTAGDARWVTDPLSRSYCPAKFRRWEPANFADLDVKAAPGVQDPFVVLEKSSSIERNFTSINFPVLRYSDILLMYAEADNVVNGGPTAKAIECLNEVRMRAGLGDIATDNPTAIISQDAFFNELVDERMREFCFESLRKTDLIRWELLGQKLAYLAIVIQGESTYSGNADQKAYLRSSEAFDASIHRSLPYPQQEVEINQNLDQKVGW